MNTPLNVSFGNEFFQLRDAWPTPTQSDPVRLLPPESIDGGDTYLSFELTPEQQKFLGHTDCKFIRLQFRKVEH